MSYPHLWVAIKTDIPYDVHMARPVQQEKHLVDKYKEIVWFLESLGLDGVEIGIIMNRDKSTIYRVISQKPHRWKRPFWFER